MLEIIVCERTAVAPFVDGGRVSGQELVEPGSRVIGRNDVIAARLLILIRRREAGMRERLQTSPLCDVEDMTRAVETA